MLMVSSLIDKNHQTEKAEGNTKQRTYDDEPERNIPA